MLYTNERYQPAREEIAAFGPLPAAASIAQEWLEFCAIDLLGDSSWQMPTRPADTPVGYDIIWPDDTVRGIRSVTPRPHELLLDVHPDALPALLGGWLPRLDLESPNFVEHGIPGLRPHLTRRGLELVWPGSGARIVISHLTRARWVNIEASLLAPDPEDSHPGEPIWPRHPDAWTPAEQSGFTGWQAYPHGQRGFPEYTWIESGMLRRAATSTFRTAGTYFLAAYIEGEHGNWPPPPQTMLERRDLLPVRTNDGEWIALPIDHGDGPIPRRGPSANPRTAEQPTQHCHGNRNRDC